MLAFAVMAAAWLVVMLLHCVIFALYGLRSFDRDQLGRATGSPTERVGRPRIVQWPFVFLTFVATLASLIIAVSLESRWPLAFVGILAAMPGSILLAVKLRARYLCGQASLPPLLAWVAYSVAVVIATAVTNDEERFSPRLCGVVILLGGVWHVAAALGWKWIIRPLE